MSVFPAGYGLAPPPSTAFPARGATILTSPARLSCCCCCEAERRRSRSRETASPRRCRVIIPRSGRSPFCHHARRSKRLQTLSWFPPPDAPRAAERALGGAQ